MNMRVKKYLNPFNYYYYIIHNISAIERKVANMGFPLADNSKRILLLKDKYKGQRCFVIGTGPSLNKTNMKLIKNEILFGVNTLYSGISRFDIKPEYWATTDIFVWKKHYKNLLDLSTVLILSGGAAYDYLRNKNFYNKYKKGEPILIKQMGLMWNENKFSTNLIDGTYNGDTVVIDICLQAAYYMGFKKVYLLGCDCDYSGQHGFDRSKGENMNCPSVRGDFSRIFKSYSICKKSYEKNGREIINATVGGKLEIFKRQKLEDII